MVRPGGIKTLQGGCHLVPAGVARMSRVVASPVLLSRVRRGAPLARPDVDRGHNG